MRYTREEGCLAWLSCGLLGSQRTRKLLDEYGSAEALYDAFVKSNGRCIQNRVEPYSLSCLRERAQKSQMHQLLLTMQQWQMDIVRPGQEGYPEALQQIASPPEVLFYRGNLAAAQGRCLTVVGTRRASPTGLASTRSICRDLSNEGVHIVSGLAVGIDSAAHEGCLDGISPTIGVMACGLNMHYPAENDDLKRRILEGGGLLLSEYPPDARVSRFVFNERNRILSGLSRAVVLMECSIPSGSLLTVQHALEQGRDVFAYPGIPNEPMSEGAHQLLREGAMYFTSALDILEDMRWISPERLTVMQNAQAKQLQPKPSMATPPTKAKKSGTPKAPKAKKKPEKQEPVPENPEKSQPVELPPMTQEQQRIYQALADGELSFDQLTQKTAMDAPSLMATLTMMQIMGIIQAKPGKTYCRSE